MPNSSNILSTLGLAWSEAYWFLLVIPFKLLWLLTTPLYLINQSMYRSANAALIRILNRIVAGRSRHLQTIRDGSKDLETYWRTYDAAPADFALYGQALGNSQWYEGRTILDVGCGVGRKSFDLAKLGAKMVLGVDSSQRNIEVAKKMAGGQPRLEFRPVEAASLKPEFLNFFDLIISFTVFEHVDNVPGVLRDLYDLQRPGGQQVIVYNHYLDRYGGHLKEFVHFPWPQLIWPENLLFDYWNRQLRAEQAQGRMGYFPPDYTHGVGAHNQDCFMNLNKLTIDQVVAMIKQTPYQITRLYRYSESPLLQRWPWMRKTPFGKYLAGSVAYVLTKPA